MEVTDDRHNIWQILCLSSVTSIHNLANENHLVHIHNIQDKVISLPRFHVNYVSQVLVA